MLFDLVWISGSLTVLYASVRVVRRRLLTGKSARYVSWGLRVFGSAFLAIGMIISWIMFASLFPREGFWTAIFLNVPIVFTVSLWAGALGGLFMEMIYPNALR